MAGEAGKRKMGQEMGCSWGGSTYLRLQGCGLKTWQVVIRGEGYREPSFSLTKGKNHRRKGKESKLQTVRIGEEMRKALG